MPHYAGTYPSSGSLARAPGKARMSTTRDIKDDTAVFGYKLRVLLHDLRNLAKDHGAQERTSQATDVLYLGAPYFSPEESAIVKAAIVVGNSTTDQAGIAVSPVSVEAALNARLENFLEKRRASGDARPCGPHDLAPIYLDVFGMSVAHLEDPKLLSRLGRTGLPPLISTTNGETGATSEKRAGSSVKEKNKSKGTKKTGGEVKSKGQKKQLRDFV